MRKFGLFAICIVISFALVAIVFAAGKSNVGHLYLYEKDSTWQIVDGGAWGKMTYNLAGPTFDFVFNGHKLEAGVSYSLIYYPDPWPGTGSVLIATGTANNGGNINLSGSVDLGMDLPIPSDANYPTGAKIWLVLSDDYNAGVWEAWTPAEYLFENNLITYDDTDD